MAEDIAGNVSVRSDYSELYIQLPAIERFIDASILSDGLWCVDLHVGLLLGHVSMRR